MSGADRPPLELEEARRRLRELGYLDGRVERFVFARALEGRGGVLVPAVLAGALACAVAVVAAAGSAEPDFAAHPSGPVVLLLHLFLAFLLPAAVAALLLGAAADRASAPAGVATAAAVGGAALVFVLWIAGTRGLGGGFTGSALVWAVPVTLSALALARSVQSGCLARAYAHTGALPARSRRGFLALVAAAGAVAAAVILAARPEPESAVPAPIHVSGGRAPVVVVAIDGIVPVSTPPGPLGAVLGRGASAWWTSAQGASPPEIWATIATGVPATRHGVRALERVRPAGSPSALRPPLGSGWYLRRVGPAISTVAAAPVSAADRRALAFWEVAATAGLPSSAIGWWASGAWPGAFVEDNRQVLAAAKTGEEADALALEALSRRTGDAIATVYLPGPDILRSEPARRDAELSRIAAWLETAVARSAAGETVLVVVTAASHGAREAPGGVYAFDGGAARSLRIRATDVAPSVLARAGIPAASDLDGRPVTALFREGSLETLTVPTYGPRREPHGDAPATTDREYLKKLKALGYLN